MLPARNRSKTCSFKRPCIIRCTSRFLGLPSPMYIVNVSLLRRKQLEVEQLSSCFYEVLGSPTNLRKYCYFFTSQSWKMRSHLLPYSKAIWTHVVCCLRKIKRSVLNKGGLLCEYLSIDNRPMKHVKIARKTELKVKTILQVVFTWYFGQSTTLSINDS